MRRLALALLLTGLLGGCSLGDNSDQPPGLGVSQDDSSATAKLGFPSSATRNTIRVGGADAAADAEGDGLLLDFAVSDLPSSPHPASVTSPAGTERRSERRRTVGAS